MIRQFRMEDIGEVMRLWLETNSSAHKFIDRSYWEENYETVKEMIPQAAVYIYEEDGEIQAFIGISEDYIAGIFVSEKFQSAGIGKRLLDYCKQVFDRLTLQVYQKNVRAVHFYLREGFSVTGKEIDQNTGEAEYTMEWVR